MAPCPEQVDAYASPTFYTSSPVKNENLTASYAFVNTEYATLHGHSNYCEILFVYKGAINNFVNGQWQLMNPGDCCLLQKGDIHKFLFVKGDEKETLGINFIVREDYFEKLRLICDDSIANEVFVKTEHQKIFHISEHEADSIYKKALAKQNLASDDIREFEITSKLFASRLLLQYIEQFYKGEEKSVSVWLLQLLEDIQNPANMSKTVAQYIQNIPYSYSYIAKEFKKHKDCSMVNHIMAVKMNHAVELLEHTNLSHLEICAKLGYSSLSHFNHIFKRFFGKTPSYYRKNNKK